jgi:hypothetical protein
MKLTENGNIRLFSANKKQKEQTSICSLQTEMENKSLFFLGRTTINGNQQLLFQQMSPSTYD